MEFRYTPINKKDTPVVSKYDVISIGGELCHHGILGMKWGKRNGPPYPLKPSDHSSAEKKAGYEKSIGGKSSGGSSGSTKKTTASKPVEKVGKTAPSKSNTKVTEGEWEDRGSYKYKQSKIQSESKTNPQKVADFDRIAKTGNNWGSEAYDIMDEYDGYGCSALSIALQKGPEAAKDYLDKKFEGLNYDFKIHEVEEEGERYNTFSLTVKGDKGSYHTSGEEDYTDEQWFDYKD